jgi:hypothetical protein
MLMSRVASRSRAQQQAMVADGLNFFEWLLTVINQIKIYVILVKVDYDPYLYCFKIKSSTYFSSARLIATSAVAAARCCCLLADCC